VIAFSAIVAGSIFAVAANTVVRDRVRQVSRSGNFELACDADTAFPLFSPEGERHWVAGWNPTPVFPDTIEFACDTVFRTGSGDEEAVWTIIEADWQTHRAEYVRVASQSHSARIVVKVEPLEAGRSKATVTYTITAFGKNSADLLAAFAEEAYATKMHDWQKQISAYLKGQKK
jgi:hypothetical protein